MTLWYQMQAWLRSVGDVEQARWVLSACAQSMAAWTALAGFFGVYRLQTLQTNLDAAHTTLRGFMVTLNEGLKLAPHDFGGHIVDHDTGAHELCAAIKESRDKVERIVGEAMEPSTVDEYFTNLIEISLPYRKVVWASSVVQFLQNAVEEARRISAVSLAFPGLAVLLSLVALLLMPKGGSDCALSLGWLLLGVILVCVIAGVASVGFSLRLLAIGRNAEPRLTVAYRDIKFKLSEDVQREVNLVAEQGRRSRNQVP